MGRFALVLGIKVEQREGGGDTFLLSYNTPYDFVSICLHTYVDKLEGISLYVCGTKSYI
jgi:hypothetical protein